MSFNIYKMRIYRHSYVDHYFPNMTSEEHELESRHMGTCDWRNIDATPPTDHYSSLL